MAQAEVGVQEVEVEHALRAWAEGQAGLALAVQQLDGAAGFLTAQHAHQSFAQAALADGLLDQVLLALPAP